ncbi:hypothetical protein CANARDRAFT_9073 [[Candida] arabinofermentans NRRL YB-2248]|uniref:Deoxycytidylate deaminase n=1 Tax=[Candida] arabinofermentans NRRL YB-2248 TaxID=983967 RepID=A0A1E4SX56_9ASCO|nr:hypothetical protein CANARDRAFT_9073 [[Candida] arabinofermentans NRRL YB-2248]
MLIGVTGTLCSGIEDVVTYLEEVKGFSKIGLVDESKNLLGSETDLIDFVTKNWRENYVLTDIKSIEFLESLLKRPFFLHVSVDRSLKLRYERYQLTKNTSFGSFAEISDNQLFDNQCTQLKIIDRSEIKIINNTKSKAELHDLLASLNLTNNERLRPSWDLYFMRLADLAALRSNCMKRRVGCVIMRENRVIATGYNGTPRNFVNCNQGGCPRCNSGNTCGVGLSTCLCLHAEENALLESGRDRIGKGAVLYCNTCPCLTCSIKIVQCGIEEVVYSQSYSMDDLSSNVFKQAGVKLRQFIPAPNGVICS